MARVEVFRWAEALVDAAADRAGEAVSALEEIAEALGDDGRRISGEVDAERLNATLGRAFETAGPKEPAIDGKPGLDGMPPVAVPPRECARRVAVMLARKGKLSSVASIVAAARGILDERAGLVRVRVETVERLSEEMRKNLYAALKRKMATDSRVASTIELEERIDPPLLGGIRVGIGWERIDGTLRRRLEGLSSALGAAKRGGGTW
jgi:hypothetical protein